MSASVDRLIVELDRAVKSLGPPAPAHRPFPGSQGQEEAAVADGMSAAERRHAAALMRINHVGEVCAQALYRAQAAATDSPALRTLFDEAAREEADHLAWTAQRLEELGSRPSLLNPLWFLGAYAAGLIAGRAGDAVSLGFVVETERQVEHHLEGHLNRLPEADTRSRAVVRQMREDEIRHGDAAENEGAARMPWPARLAMQMAAKVMTSTAYWL